MVITVLRQVDVSGLTKEQIEVIHAANELLEPEQHAPDCPVRHGASVDCVWPIAVCYPDTFTNVYSIDHHTAVTEKPE